jgi:hypothetical protein
MRAFDQLAEELKQLCALPRLTGGIELVVIGKHLDFD